MAAHLPSMQQMIWVWLVAGGITLCGALSNAELACMFPETGGQYIFFKKIYGDLVAYIYGWASVFIFNTAGIASIAYVAVYYFDYLNALPRLPREIEQYYFILLPGLGKIYFLEHISRKVLTIFLLVIFSWINANSLAWGDTTQKSFTVVKYVSILGLTSLFIMSHSGSLVQWHESGKGHSGIAGWAAALTGAFWCFDGWNNIGFVGGEIKQPQQTIPRSLLHGILSCLALYIFFTISLFFVLPLDQIAGSSFVAAAAAEKIGGVFWATLVVIMIIVSVAGAVNGNVLACSRVSYSFFRDFPFLKKAGTLNRRGLPAHAVWVNTAWASVLVLSGSFDQLTDMLIFVSWIFYALSAAGVIVARRKLRHIERPYAVPFFPILPLLFILFSAVFLGMCLYSDFSLYAQGKSDLVKSGFGLLILAIGIPFYLLYSRKTD